MSSCAADTVDLDALEADADTLHASVATEHGGLSHYWVYNSRSAGPRVLLIAGLSAAHYAWETTVAHLVLQRDARVMCVDNRGAGMSRETPGPYTAALMARDTRQCLVDAAWWPASDADPDAAEGVHVVGISLGGMIAQELALLRPGAVASLSLVSTHAGGSVLTTLPSLRAVLALASLLLSRPDPNSDRALLLSARTLHTDEYLARWGDEIAAGLRRLMVRSPATSQTAYRAQLEAVRGHRALGRLAAGLRGRLRACVVAGAQDALIPARHSRAMAQELGCPLHVLEGAGHGLTSLHGPEHRWFMDVLWGNICPEKPQLEAGDPVPVAATPASASMRIEV
eukprot:m51a1_g6438 hypothetical protein (341) ;mRNA; f:371955-373083